MQSCCSLEATGTAVWESTVLHGPSKSPVSFDIKVSVHVKLLLSLKSQSLVCFVIVFYVQSGVWSPLNVHYHNNNKYSVSQKIPPPLRACIFVTFSSQTNFLSIFMHLLYVPIYARLQIFIQLSPTLTKLCHIKRNFLVHIIMLKMSIIGWNARVQMFAKVVDHCLWQVIPDLLLL